MRLSQRQRTLTAEFLVIQIQARQIMSLSLFFPGLWIEMVQKCFRSFMSNLCTAHIKLYVFKDPFWGQAKNKIYRKIHLKSQ